MEPLEGERTVSGVASKKKPWLTTRRKVLLITGGTILVIGFVFWKDTGRTKEEAAVKPPPSGVAQRVPFEMPPPLPMPILAAMPNPLPPARPDPLPPIVAEARPLRETVREAVAVPATVSHSAAPRMLSFATAADKTPEAAGGERGDTSRGATTHVTYKGAEIVGAKAGPAMDTTLLLMPGVIHAILDSAIDSTLPGPLIAHLEAPVISDSGVVLMDKGTRIIGSYSNEIRQGQGRLMAVSATAYTPQGVPVPLGGPFADNLGRAGLDGDVENHYAARFGAAVLLSLGESALGIVNSSVSKGGNSYVSLSSGGGVGSLAQEVLRSTIDIKPTISKPQGSEISLWILTPISFEASYKLQKR